MKDGSNFLASQPIGRLLLRLALPTLAAQFASVFYSVIDRIYIGHIPETGALSLSALGVSMPIVIIIASFAALVGYGGAPRASIYMGGGDTQMAERTLGACFAMQTLVSLILMAVLLIWNKSLLTAFGAGESVLGYALGYMNIYALSAPFMQIALGMNAFITAQGFAKTSMISVALGAVCNIILDPIFIFGLDMGLRGAAMATVLSQAVSCAWVLSFLLGKRTLIRLRRPFIRLDMPVLLPCLALGSASFIMQASESVIIVAFNSSLMKYGGDMAVGAMAILTSVMQFAQMPLNGIGQGAQPIISYNYGMGSMQRVKAAFGLLLRVSLGYSLCLWAFVMLFPSAFAGIFTPDATLAAFAARALRIYMAGTGLFGIQIACQMTFSSLAKAKAAISVAVVRKFVLLLPLIYLMPTILPQRAAMAVYMAEPVADILAVCFTAFLFSRLFKKAISEGQSRL